MKFNVSSRKLFRWSGGAAIASGVCAILAAASVLLAPVIPGTPVFVNSLLLLAVNVLSVYVLVGLYGCQVVESGGLGLIGFIVALTGYLLGMVGFYAPFGWLVFLTGAVLLAVAVGRAGVLPGWGALMVWLWFLGALVTVVAGVVELVLLVGLGLAIHGAARIGLGIAMRRRLGQGGV